MYSINCALHSSMVYGLPRSCGPSTYVTYVVHKGYDVYNGADCLLCLFKGVD